LKRDENIFLGLIGTENPYNFGALNARLWRSVCSIAIARLRVFTQPRPICDIGQIEMPQCSSPPFPKGVLLSDMRRREFITLLGGVALAWPLAAQAERIRRIGVLSPYPADDPDVMERIGAFRQGMQEHGWSEGRNLQIDYRWAGADPARLRSYASAPGDRQGVEGASPLR
jgi:hypothetical protein